MLHPCSSCHRHLREADATCPFCGAVQRSVGNPLAGLGGFVLVAVTTLGTAGCSPDASGDGGMTTTTAGESTTGNGETETGATTVGDGDGDTTTTTDSSGSFYALPGDAGVLECDPFAQDCPVAEKCMPRASTGELFDENICVPVVGDDNPGEPCFYNGPAEPFDSCDETSHCWYTELVDGELQGVCVPFCTGTADNPGCGDGTSCLIEWNGTVTLCLASCDPLMQDCPVGQMCSWSETGAFVCLSQPDPAPATGEVCEEFVDACGLNDVCMDAGLLTGCAGSHCCTEYCDVTDGAFVCSNPELSCHTFWQNAQAPPGLENLGVCATEAP